MVNLAKLGDPRPVVHCATVLALIDNCRYCVAKGVIHGIQTVYDVYLRKLIP